MDGQDLQDDLRSDLQIAASLLQKSCILFIDVHLISSRPNPKAEPAGRLLRIRIEMQIDGVASA